MPDSSTEKTEPATQKRREDERKKGNIFMSKDINTLVSLIAGFYAFSFFITSAIEKVGLNYQQQIERALTIDTVGTETILDIYTDILLILGTTLVPAMLIIMLASIAITMFQTRFLVSTESLKFKLERISLLKGFKRFFSLRSLVELAKSLIKIILLTWLLYRNIQKAAGDLPSMMDWDIWQAMSFMGDTILSLLITVVIAFGAIALLDFLYQRWEYEKGIRMTKQEIKDEYKQMEGDPQIKSKRRQRQQELAQKRMMQQVKDADVIVRNPTHYAVALKYTIDKDPAPMVLAKGADLIAQKIVEEGEKYGIVTVENKPLARGLYEAADVFGYIPAEFFQPVAELLAWLFSNRENARNPARPPAAKPPQGTVQEHE